MRLEDAAVDDVAPEHLPRAVGHVIDEGRPLGSQLKTLSSIHSASSLPSFVGSDQASVPMIRPF
jgi:hypothetical protein